MIAVIEEETKLIVERKNLAEFDQVKRETIILDIHKNTKSRLKRLFKKFKGKVDKLNEEINKVINIFLDHIAKGHDCELTIDVTHREYSGFCSYKLKYLA